MTFHHLQSAAGATVCHRGWNLNISMMRYPAGRVLQPPPPTLQPLDAEPVRQCSGPHSQTLYTNRNHTTLMHRMVRN